MSGRPRAIAIQLCAIHEGLPLRERRGFRTWRRYRHALHSSMGTPNVRHGAAQRLVGRLDDLFNTPVGHKPEERDGNIERDRDRRPQ